MADILRLGPATKTQVLYGLNLRRPQVQDYLDFLVKKGFLELSQHSKRATYKPTQRGQQLLDCIEKVTRVLEVESLSGSLKG